MADNGEGRLTLAFLVAAWLGGVLLGLETDVRLAAVFLLLGASACLGLALYVARWPVFPAVLAALLLLGVWRAEPSQAELPQLTTQFEQIVSVEALWPTISRLAASGPGSNWR